jgi:hypothetical protein
LIPMDPRKLFVDKRLVGLCVYCGAVPDSRDHCPSKVLLDDPFPEDLPVVEACIACNNSFSLDEQYLACLIEIVVSGSANPNDIGRERIKTILIETPALTARIEEKKRIDEAGNLIWDVDADRVRRIVLKLARGHIAYELSLPKIEEPDSVSIMPLMLMSEEERTQFECSGEGSFAGWPEIGSRAFIKAVKEVSNAESNPWTIVQPGRYRYMVGQSDGDFVRLVIGEYLSCHIAWH